MNLSYETLIGPAIKRYIADVAAFRLEGFRAFPYLYQGTQQYEEKYLEGYTSEPRAMLIRVSDGNRVVAVATATPLATNADIVADAPELFRKASFDPAEFFYYAEILVNPAYRGFGIARQIYEERERIAREYGFKRLCLAVVVRPEDHPLRPRDYVSPERIWVRDGFRKTAITFDFEWPTIQPDGRVAPQANPMVFWTKDI